MSKKKIRENHRKVRELKTAKNQLLIMLSSTIGHGTMRDAHYGDIAKECLKDMEKSKYFRLLAAMYRGLI